MREEILNIKNIDSGKYILLITYPHYADFADQLLVTDSSQMMWVLLA